MGQFWNFLNGAARMLVMIALVIVCINAMYSKEVLLIAAGVISLIGVIDSIYKLFRNVRGN